MADYNLKSISAETSLALSAFLFGADDQSSATPVPYAVQTLLNLLAKTLNALVFYPKDNNPPSSNYATLDTRNGHAVLDFDTTTGESAIFEGIIPRSYAGNGLVVEVGYSMTSATSGTCGWLVAFERVGNSQQDTDSDSFASSQTITAATVPGTSGHVAVLSVNVSDGANMDSVAAGEQFRIKVTRDVSNDNGAGDAELHWVRIREQ